MTGKEWADAVVSRSRTAGATGDGSSEEHRTRQRQARALGDPTRYEIFRLVAESGPLGVAPITARLGLNHNAIRQHLTKLCEAGLLVEEVARQGGPGRPPLQYRLAPSVVGSWGTPAPYEDLSLLLLELLDGDASPYEVGFAAGQRAVASASPDAPPIDVIEDDLARRGFEPARRRDGDAVELALRRCPFESAAAANPDVVCELHRGIAQGVIDALGDDVELVGLLVRDPSHRDCRLRVRVPDPA